MTVEIITYINIQVILNQRHKTFISNYMKAVSVIVGSPHCHKATTETSAEEKVVTRPEEKCIFNQKFSSFFQQNQQENIYYNSVLSNCKGKRETHTGRHSQTNHTKKSGLL